MLMQSIVRQTNQHAVKVGPFFSAGSITRTYWSVPAVNIDLDQRDNGPFKAYFEFGVLIGGEYNHYLLSEVHGTSTTVEGGERIVPLLELERVTFRRGAAKPHKETIASAGSSAFMIPVLRNLFSAGEIVSRPERFYDKAVAAMGGRCGCLGIDLRTECGKPVEVGHLECLHCERTACDTRGRANEQRRKREGKLTFL